MIRGRSLGVRLAVILAGVVIVVLLGAGWVVNRAASRSLDETLGPREEQRLALAVTVVEEALERGIDRRGLGFLLQRIVAQSGGTVRVVDDAGAVLAQAGRLPPNAARTDAVSRDLSDAAGGGAFELVVPDVEAPFVRTFNAALLLTGGVAVASLVVASVLIASRMTRPLREVTAAAHRLGQGDLAARARGGSDAESAELASAFNGMADRLQRSEELRRRAASDLAHDLATPATVLEAQLQAIVDGVVPADRAQVEKARAAASGLSGVIAQLGELTLAESAPLQRNVERVTMVDLAREIIASLEPAFLERGVVGIVEGDARAVANVDRGQVTRALRNIVTNSMQHSPDDGTVRIGLEGGSTVEVRVQDTGAGIADHDRPFVFERFYRADRSRGSAPGSGIGLTVARELIVANGGSVEIEATGEAGTTFVVRLPSAPIA